MHLHYTIPQRDNIARIAFRRMNSDTTNRRVVFRTFATAILIALKNWVGKIHIRACEKSGQRNKALGRRRKLPILNMGKRPYNRNALR